MSLLHTFFNAITTWLPTSVHISFPSVGDSYNDTTGALTGSWTASSNADVVGGSLDSYAAPAGAVVNWNTAGIVNGRRVRGRTFIVPVARNGYDTDGTLSAAFVSALDLAASDLVTNSAGGLLVWHRPVGGVGGSAHSVTGHRVRDKIAVLRSRRD